jgi:hypothetical protein
MRKKIIRKGKISHKVSIQDRFLQVVFRCQLETLARVCGLIIAFEEEYKYDLVKDLVEKISDMDSEFLLARDKNYGKELLYYIISEYIRRFMKSRGISEDNTFMELLYEEVLKNIEHLTIQDPNFMLGINLDEYLAYYEISPEIYNELLKALNSFVTKVI